MPCRRLTVQELATLDVGTRYDSPDQCSCCSNGSCDNFYCTYYLNDPSGAAANPCPAPFQNDAMGNVCYTIVDVGTNCSGGGDCPPPTQFGLPQEAFSTTTGCVTGICCGNTCCPPDQNCCNNSCCDGECINQDCCPKNLACNGTCCGGTDTCVAGVCCPPERTCNDGCCADGETCIGNQCCPSANTCGNQCCTPDQSCIDGTCTTNITTCPQISSIEIEWNGLKLTWTPGNGWGSYQNASTQICTYYTINSLYGNVTIPIYAGIYRSTNFGTWPSLPECSSNTISGGFFIQIGTPPGTTVSKNTVRYNVAYQVNAPASGGQITLTKVYTRNYPTPLFGGDGTIVIPPECTGPTDTFIETEPKVTVR